ncbi:hypothetical protein ACFQHO_04180 [Actinomadura yumaensis]|uniref:hypothetical protein n=1 Tax=Actinomadura yumaensis TaxID=111807 RepID=UPI0036233CB6
MSRFAIWFGKNADAAIALILAVVVAVLGIGVNLPDERDIINSAILAVIGLLATSVLRDRGGARRSRRRSATRCGRRRRRWTG